MYRLVVVLTLLAGCLTMSMRSGGSHIDNANAALARGDYDVAQSEYTLARQRAEGKGEAWVKAEADRGEAKIQIARLRAQLPDLRTPGTSPAMRVAELHEKRVALRGELGGDAALDGELVVILGEHAARWVADDEARAARGEVYAAGHSVGNLLRIVDVPAHVIARARAIRAKAADASRARAAAAGEAHPLARQLHLAIAASFVGGQLPASAAVLAPYLRGVEVTVSAPASCALASLPTDLAQPGTIRRVRVAVTVATCTATENTAESQETATWTEKVLDGYDTVYVEEQQCEKKCGSVLSGGENCTTNYNTNPPTLLCTKNTISNCINVCAMVRVPKQEPRYRDEPRSGERKVTTRTSSAIVEGTWVVRRDGQEWAGTIAASPSSRMVHANSLGGARARMEGAFTSPADLVTSVRKATAAAIQSKLDIVFTADVERAVSAARAAAGKLDDEEEAWIRAVVLGGQDIGPVAARYDIEHERALTLLHSTSYSGDSTPTVLPADRVFAIVARADTDAVTGNDRSELAKYVPPVFGGKYWLQLDVAYLSLPIVTDASGRMFSGDSALVVGARGATRVIGRKSSMFGLRLADELSMAVGLGGRTGGPEVMDDPIAGFAGTFSGHYALGIGYRAPGRGALFAGARGSYAVFLIGTSTGSYTSLPLFARVEVPLTFGSLSAEVVGSSLYGTSQLGLSIHLSSKRRSAHERLKYFQLRIEQTTVDPSVQDFDTGNGSRSLGDQSLTAVHLMYGIGI